MENTKEKYTLIVGYELSNGQPTKPQEIIINPNLFLDCTKENIDIFLKDKIEQGLLGLKVINVTYNFDKTKAQEYIDSFN